MARIATEVIVAGLALQRRTAGSLREQLTATLRQAILTGRLRAGQRLPATRALALAVGVSRTTAALAYEQLQLEGYLSSRPGSGTFAAAIRPESLAPAKPSDAPATPPERLPAPDLGLPQPLLQRYSTQESRLPFEVGLPDLAAFPFATWARLARRVFRNLASYPLGYGDAAGYGPLREAIAGYLRTTRAVRCEPEQVLIVNGSQQGLQLIAQCLLQPGDQAWVEDPGYPGIRAAFRRAGLQLCPVPVDAEGLDVAYASQHYPQARIMYLTPSHQFPLGVTMSAARRVAVLSQAQRADMWVIEDDYDSEFHYQGQPLPSLQGLDAHNRVLYTGTFSKTIFPALRLGYLVLPSADMARHFSQARAMLDRQSSLTDQAILSDFIQQEHLARHLRRMRQLYQRQQDQLLAELARTSLGDLLTVRPSRTGMHLVGWLPPEMSDQAVARRAAELGVKAHAVSEYVLEHPVRPGLLLGFTGFAAGQLSQGVQALAEAIRSSQPV
jgi:GntR family transcriptional regulator/MocR family aminotransferase